MQCAIRQPLFVGRGDRNDEVRFVILTDERCAVVRDGQLVFVARGHGSTAVRRTYQHFRKLITARGTTPRVARGRRKKARA